MKRSKSVLVRGAGLLAVIAVGSVLVIPPLLEKRQEERIRSVLLEVQEALQEYHVEEELYPRQMMNGRELVSLLSERGFLRGDLVNPWTLGNYEDTGEDWLRYRTDSLAETYELIVFFPETDREQFRLDSTENQSLEE